MINVPNGKEFIFQDGSRAKNLLELVSNIERLSDHEFHHFVNVHKNDFANWADHVLTDRPLSSQLRAVNTKSETLSLLKDKISDIVTSRMEGRSLHDASSTPRLEYDKRSDARTGWFNIHHEHRSEHPAENQDDYEKAKHAESSDVDEKEEKDIKKESGRIWFKLFSKKKSSEENLKELGLKEEEKLHIERELKEELHSDENENSLWVMLYIALVVLIITLLVYKLFL